MTLCIAGIIAAIILLAAIYFNQPYSPLKTDFNKNAEGLITKATPQTGIITEQDIADLPEPVRKYFQHCTLIGTPQISWQKTEFTDVPFSTGVGKPNLNIDYIQYNFVEQPNRLAFINSSMYGIPFQGFDSFQQGVGSMKGMLAKAVTLFDQKGPELDKASLATVLAESLFIPNIALQDYITWEAIDDTHAKATINAFGLTAGGIFTFSEAGEALKFTTNDRMAVDFDDKMQSIPWSALYEDYQRDEKGILRPTVLKAIWHYPEGDLIYFDGKIKTITSR